MRRTEIQGTNPTGPGKPAADARLRFEGLEAGRGVAALLVVLYHGALQVEGSVPESSKVLWGLPHFGHAGVDFFFVLSGFIIAFVHGADIGQPERLAHYLQRRLTRIFPFYWLVLGFSLLDLAVLHRQQFPGIGEIVSNALLLPQATDQIVGVAWSLVFEVMFYAAFAVAICSRIAGLWLLTLWFGLIAVALALHEVSLPGALLSNASSPFCLEFMLGMGAAYVLSRHRLRRSGVVLLAALVAFGGAGMLEIRGELSGYGPLARIVYGGLSVLIVAALVERERSGWGPMPRIMTLLGRSSYAIYLVHYIAIGVGFKVISHWVVLKPSYSLLLWLVLCAAGILAGVAASSWFEQPAIRFARRYLARAVRGPRLSMPQA
jgi:peptidoglycan/LPS O-acetylase OafA/YrhL